MERDNLSALDALKEDEALREFLEHDIEQNKTSLVYFHSLGLSEQLSAITRGISQLDCDIADHVNSHYEDLLSQATGTETLEDVLATMDSRIQTLLCSVERLRSRIVEPLSLIETQSATLARLHDACDILRRVIRVQYLSRRLQSQLSAGIRDVTKAAKTISELDEITSGVDMTGVAVYEKELRQIRAGRQQVEEQAHDLLHRGLETLNQSQVATALQVHCSLGSLSTVLQLQVTDAHAAVCRALADAFSQSADRSPSTNHNRSQSAGSGSAAVSANPVAAALQSNGIVRTALWSGMEAFTAVIYSQCARVYHLQKVLVKKRDVFSDCVATVYLLPQYWQNVTLAVGEQLTMSSDKQLRARYTLEAEYPKLLRLCSELWHKIDQLTAALSATGDQSHTFSAETGLRDALEPLQKAYLSRSLSRLFDPVNLMFSTDAVPTRDELDAIVKIMNNELTVTAFDAALVEKISGNVSKTIYLFCTKCEGMLSTDGDATQVIGGVTASQQRNAALINLLWQLETRGARRLAERLQPAAGGAEHGRLQPALKSLSELPRQALQPQLDAIQDAIHSILLTMHAEDFSGDENEAGESESAPSLFVKELQQFISRVVADYLTGISCNQLLQSSKLALARRTVELFVRHAALVRPMGSAGRLRMAANCAHLELALAPLCDLLTDMGHQYRTLRAFKPILFQTSEQVCRSPAVGELLRYSLVLQLLLGRCGAVDQQPVSPHDAAGWSAARYSRWLDQHPTEHDRLQLLTAALDAHVQSVKARGQTQFAPLYPLLLQLLQRATTATSS